MNSNVVSSIFSVYASALSVFKNELLATKAIEKREVASYYIPRKLIASFTRIWACKHIFYWGEGGL
jgi:hypothetical protein